MRDWLNVMKNNENFFSLFQSVLIKQKDISSSNYPTNQQTQTQTQQQNQQTNAANASSINQQQADVQRRQSMNLTVAQEQEFLKQQAREHAMKSYELTRTDTSSSTRRSSFSPTGTLPKISRAITNDRKKSA